MLASLHLSQVQRVGVPILAHEFTDFTNTHHDDDCYPISVDTMNPKNIIHSESSLELFMTCPKQYEAKQITKTVKFQPTAATAFGNRVHEALENRLKVGTPLPRESAHLEAMCVSLLAMKGTHYVEHSLSIDADLGPKEYWDKEGWFRGKVDFKVFDAETGYLRVFDFKTGKPKPASKQLERALLAVRNMPKGVEVKKVRSAFIYTATGTVDKQDIPMERFDGIVDELQRDAHRVDMAITNNVFPPKPSGLCREWCQVKCAFNGRPELKI